MKLYSTTTSERASKSQGGNQFLATDYFVGSEDESVLIGSVRLEFDPNDGLGAYRLELVDASGNVSASIRMEKGEKQKGKCESKNHTEHDEFLWRCSGCKKHYCFQEGAADNHADLCDDCAAEIGKKQKDDICTDGKPHRFVNGECTGQDCYK